MESALKESVLKLVLGIGRGIKNWRACYTSEPSVGSAKLNRRCCCEASENGDLEGTLDFAVMPSSALASPDGKPAGSAE